LVLWVLLQLGLDLPFMRQWTGFLLSQTPLIVVIAVAALALSLPLAVAVTLGRLSMNPLARGCATAFVSVVRGIPLIVLLFFFFIALPQIASLGPHWVQSMAVLSPTTTAILAIGFFHAGYISELLRAGFLSVAPGQWEAASAIGMSAAQARRRIIWPQAAKFALRPVTNHFVMMLKDTALVGFLGVPILFQRAERIGSQNLKMFETILIAALIYWVLTTLSWKLIDILDRQVPSSARPHEGV
jgi:His/Glu/Gln/Arg/opine family amino acid ABC transporter permease subunit